MRGYLRGLLAQSVSESTSVDVDVSYKWISLLKILQICKKKFYTLAHRQHKETSNTSKTGDIM